jgi:hypothetical protein
MKPYLTFLNVHQTIFERQDMNIQTCHLKPLFSLTDILESLPQLLLNMLDSLEPPSSLEIQQGHLGLQTVTKEKNNGDANSNGWPKF